MTIDITDNLMAQYKPKEGVIGRYSCSKIWAINNNYCNPQQYLKGEDIKFENALLMILGTHKHTLIQSLLTDYQQEVKIEKKINDFVVVGKCDCINDNEILEIKTSDKVYSEAKRWHIYQLKLYLSLFGRETGRIVQPIISKNKLLLKILAEVKKDDKWFDEEMEKLGEFHNKLLKINK